MPSSVSKAVLITGCSTGIGRATAIRLTKAGWSVYATARNLDSIADLRAHGCKLLQLDVTDADSRVAAVKAVEDGEGAVGVLINNAGYGLHGAVETVGLDEVRAQFETNFFGLVGLTQLVLPGMRKQHWGKIVNMSSMGGKLTFPGGGFYHATKHALESLSDALRFEVAPFGIDVVIIEPGLIKTEFGGTAIASVDNSDVEDSPYGFFNQGVMLKINGAYNGKLANAASGPDSVAKVITRAISSKRPRTRYPVTAGAWAIMGLRRVLPDKVFDYLLQKQYPTPGS
ncbi:MAG: oxidoreductase [Actinomycetota bacterium]